MSRPGLLCAYTPPRTCSSHICLLHEILLLDHPLHPKPLLPEFRRHAAHHWLCHWWFSCSVDVTYSMYLETPAAGDLRTKITSDQCRKRTSTSRFWCDPKSPNSTPPSRIHLQPLLHQWRLSHINCHYNREHFSHCSPPIASIIKHFPNEPRLAARDPMHLSHLNLTSNRPVLSYTRTYHQSFGMCTSQYNSARFQ